MPLYEYECPVCGRFEHLQAVQSPVLEDCPTCGSKVKKVVSRTYTPYGPGFRTKNYREAVRREVQEIFNSGGGLTADDVLGPKRRRQP